MGDKAKVKSTVSEAARILGTKGGESKSPAKQRQARINGKKGGRPEGSTNKK